MHAVVQPTIWEVPNDVWTMIEPILDECYPAKPKGHRRVELRGVLDGIFLGLLQLACALLWMRRRARLIGD
jgi:hypothetical protein